MAELATIITAVAALVAAIGTVINAVKIREVKYEVKTANDQTLAQLSDAVESRRIQKIAKGKRTKLEDSHLKDVGGA